MLYDSDLLSYDLMCLWVSSLDIIAFGVLTQRLACLSSKAPTLNASNRQRTLNRSLRPFRRNPAHPRLSLRVPPIRLI